MDKQKQIDLMVEYMFDYARTLVDIKTATEDSKFVNYYKKTLKGYANFLVLAGYSKIPENAVVLTREEYERFQRIENTIKRFSTISPTEAETENKALKETIGIVLAQKRNVWKSYNQLKEEYAKTRKETAEKFAERLKEKSYRMFSNGGNFEFTIDTKSLDEICKEITEGKV